MGKFTKNLPVNSASSNKNKLASDGFTILELLIATAVFSVVLLLCATAIVQVGRMYYKSILQVRTMDTNRAISDDLTQAIQFGERSNSFYGYSAQTYNNAPYGSILVRSLCLGSIRYSYVLGIKSLGNDTTNQLPHIFMKDRYNGSGCPPQDITAASATGTELLGTDMRILEFNVAPPLVGGVPDTSGIWTITTKIAYGSTDDLFTDTLSSPPDDVACIGSIIGGQFCSISSITTNAIKRL